MPRSKIVTGQKITPAKLERAKEMRREMMPAEEVLWQRLRRSRLGAHFRRQQIIAGFIVDFYSHSARLVIELDGRIHEVREQRQEDARREKIMREMDLRIVRFKNEDVTADLERVLRYIRGLIAPGWHRCDSPFPLGKGAWGVRSQPQSDNRV